MAVYVLAESTPGYFTSLDAKNRQNQRNVVQPNTYFIYEEKDGVINVTSQLGVPGSWINPDSPVTSKQANPGSASRATSAVRNNYSTSATPTLNSSGSNKKVYALNKEYIPCYIINLLTGGKIEFECEPEEISDANSAQFDPQDVRGRSSPYQGYSSSGPRTISFSVMLHDDLCKEGILNTVNHLRSLTYPNYGGVLTPPKCLVRVGDMIHCNAIVNDVSVSWQKPYRNGTYVAAEVSLNLTEVVDTPYSSSEIWSKGGYK